MTVQRAFEEAGIPTVIIASLPAIAVQSGAPRILAVDTPMGAALGEPANIEQQRRILRAALALLEGALTPGTVASIGERYRT